jgi:carboxymethylenebutenolidase
VLLLAATACSLQRWQPATSSQSGEHASHMSMSSVAMAGSAPADGNQRLSQGIAGIPASNAAAAERLRSSPRKGEFAKVPYAPGAKDSLEIWVSYPQSRAKAPVVVVIHDNQGLSIWVRAVADQLAADGFVAVAPDLLSRARGGASEVELSGDSVRKIIGPVNFTERNLGIAAAANYAMSLPAAERRYGIVGYCWGGSTSFNHAVSNGTGLAVAVAYYGLPYMNGAVPITDSLAKIRVPVMLLNGSRDARIGAALPAVDSAMKALGKTFSFENYEGATHGFMRSQDDPAAGANADAGPANVVAAKDAWPRTIAFLKKNLGVK